MTTVDSAALTIPVITDEMDNLTAALEYVKAGWYVLPTDPRKDGKDPGSVVGGRWPAKSSRDPKQITAWFAGTDYGVALHCGRSGAVVLDVDDPENVPDEVALVMESGGPYQSTRKDQPTRGHYLVYNNTGRRIGNGLGKLATTPKWGEVRGANGVIIAAPSAHTEGGHYRWERTGPVLPLPDYVAEALPDSQNPEDTATDAQVKAFVDTHTKSERPEILKGLVNALKSKLDRGASCHMSTLGIVTSAMAEAAAGFYPAREALTALWEVYRATATTGTSTGRVLTAGEAKHDFAGILSWAVGQANAGNIEKARARIGAKMPSKVAWVDTITTENPQTGGRSLKYVGHTAQLRFAHYLADAFTGKLLHVHGIGWHYWDGKRWAYDDTGVAWRAVYELLKELWPFAFGDGDEQKKLAQAISRCETANGVQGILTLARALPRFAATLDDLDADPHLLNAANGTLDLRTGELRPHSPAYRITKVCRGAYHPDAESALWQAFLTRVLPDEGVRGFVQRLAGVGLIGQVREHILPIWTGTGANGKGSLDRALQHTLGDYAIAAEPDLFMHRDGAHPTGEMDLRGVRWVTVSESDRDRRLAEATMKRLTGGDRIRARRMRQDFVEFVPSHTASLITNHLPKVRGDDPAIWRRIRVIPFDVVIPPEEQDGELDDRLQLEADAVLTWAVNGWRQYQRGGLDAPAVVIAATDRYHRESHAVSRFVEDRCLTGSTVNKATTEQLFKAWEQWRREEGADEISMKVFGQSLDKLGYPTSPPCRGKRFRSGIAVMELEAAE